MSSTTHRLLVAEDDAEIRQALDRTLTDEGDTAIAVNDGAARDRLASRAVTIDHLQR